MTEPLRGDIWIVNFNPVIGHEQGGERPALIMSVDAFNASAGEDVFVVPMTSKYRKIRTRVTVNTPEGGLKVDSYVICDKMRSLSRRRLKNRLGAVSNKTIAEVEAILRQILGF